MDKTRIRILVANDKNDLRSVIRDYLKEDGFTDIQLSENGLSTLRKARAEAPGLIIADYDLPGLDGLELLKEIRGDRNLKDTPYILVSSERQQQVVAQAAEYSVSGYIIKPFSHQTLSEKVERALQKTFSPTTGDIMYAEANRLAESGDLDAALDRYMEALETTKGVMASIHYKIGRIHERQDKRDDAESDYHEALAMSDLFVNAYDALGSLKFQKEENEEALRLFRKGAAISPLNAVRQMSLGEALLESGDNEAAEKAFRLALDLDPTQTHAFNRLGISLRRQGRQEEALQFFLRAEEAAENDENLYYNISRVYLDLGGKAKALEYLKKALEVNPDFPEARDMMVNIDV